MRLVKAFAFTLYLFLLWFTPRVTPFVLFFALVFSYGLIFILEVEGDLWIPPYLPLCLAFLFLFSAMAERGIGGGWPRLAFAVVLLFSFPLPRERKGNGEGEDGEGENPPLQ